MNQCGWIETTESSKTFPSLNKNLKTHFLIIGGGISGISCAINLATLNPSAHITLVERQLLGQGASSRNSGFVVCHEKPDDGEYWRQAGFENYRHETRFGMAASQLLAQYIERFQIDCDYDAAGYYIGVSDIRKMSSPARLLETLEAVGAQATLCQGASLAHALGTDFYQLAIHCAGGNALIQPAKYVQGLLAALPAQVEVYEQFNVSQIRSGPLGALEAHGNGRIIRADHIIVCAGAFAGRAGLQGAHVLPLELSASLTRPLSPPELAAIGNPRPWGMLSAALTGATVRLTRDRRLMIRNTLEFRRRDLAAADLHTRRQRHLSGLQRRFPWLDDQAIAFSWSGHLGGTRGGRPLFKQMAPNLFAVSGCNGSGLARGTLWGKLLAEYASGVSSEMLTHVLAHGSPGWLPPTPFLDIGASLKIAHERFKSSSEI